MILCLMQLVTTLVFAMLGARRLGFSGGDEIAAVFRGSKKNRASGLPFVQVLFASAPGVGMLVLLVLPVMLYNHARIIVEATLARRYAAGFVSIEKPYRCWKSRCLSVKVSSNRWPAKP